tara:strand:+ start:150 stop:323 length:174 start_codon:yes stop_codon:yes gene_type:complete
LSYDNELQEFMDMSQDDFMNSRDWFGYDGLVQELYAEGYTPDEALEYIEWVIEKHGK